MGSFGHKALKPSRGLGSASWPQCSLVCFRGSREIILCGPGCGPNLCGGQFQRPKGRNFGSLVPAWWKSTRMQRENGSCSRLRYTAHCWKTAGLHIEFTLNHFFRHWGFHLNSGWALHSWSRARPTRPSLPAPCANYTSSIWSPCFFGIARWPNGGRNQSNFRPLILTQPHPASTTAGDTKGTSTPWDVWETCGRPTPG